MNRAKSVSIESKSRVAKSALGYRVDDGSNSAEKKNLIRPGKIRTRMEHELDLVVGRSIN